MSCDFILSDQRGASAGTAGVCRSVFPQLQFGVRQLGSRLSFAQFVRAQAQSEARPTKEPEGKVPTEVPQAA